MKKLIASLLTLAMILTLAMTAALAEEPAEVYAVVVPLMQVQAGIQGDISLVDQAPAAAKVVLPAQVVILQEHKYILFVDLHHSHLHCGEVHRAEGGDKFLLVRQNASLEGDLHGRGLVLLRENPRKVFPESRSAHSLEPLVEGQGHVSLAAFEVH